MVEDPDAPTPMPFVHWLVHGLSPTTTLVSGGKTGKTTMRHDRFDGPAPPPGHGPHHYHFQVFALDRELGLDDGVGRTELLDAMEGHVIAAGEIVGIYER
jgi:Raf kinase inhibitor-like YbhB/YbcL family protein